MVDYKMAHTGSVPTPEYLKSVGLDPASEALAKVDAALAKVVDLQRRLDAILALDAEAAAAAARSRREVAP